jgi:chromosome segregation ATPase
MPCEVLKQFAERSQLVVISHNRLTIESADTLDTIGNSVYSVYAEL